MDAALGAGYGTGTISVEAGGTTVTGAGTDFVTWVTGGYPLFAGGVIAPTLSVTDATHIELALPWPGETLTGSTYFIQDLSRAQLEFDVYRRNVRKMVATWAGGKTIVRVPADQAGPDPGLGDDDDLAIRIIPGAAWTFFQKVDGVWQNVGAPIGMAWSSVWSVSKNYITNDIVTRLGRVYIALQSGANHPPETSPEFWELLLQGGERYEILWSDSDMPASGEVIHDIEFTTTVTFPAGMAESRAGCREPATADAVFSLLKNGVEFATYTFAAGATAATFVCPSETTFNAGDVYSEVAPAPRDSTLARVRSSKVGFR